MVARLTDAQVQQRCQDAGIKLLEPFTVTRRVYLVRYSDCGHEETKGFQSVGRSGCRSCSPSKPLTPEQVQQRCDAAGVELLEPFKAAGKKHRVRYRDCGHEDTKWFYDIGKRGCWECSPSKPLTAAEVQRRCDEGGVELLEPYQATSQKHLVRYRDCGHVYLKVFSDIENKGCNRCPDKRLLSEREVQQRCDAAGVELLEPFRGVNHRHDVRCLSCGQETQQLFASLGKVECLSC
jgi:molybdopterin/thiamine biosynthesis adenylyltransferase